MKSVFEDNGRFYFLICGVSDTMPRRSRYFKTYEEAIDAWLDYSNNI